MFYARRKRLKELADRETAGEDLWSEELTERARVQLFHELDGLRDVVWENASENFFSRTRQLVLKDEGLLTLQGTDSVQSDVREAVLSGDTELALTVVEAAVFVLRVLAQRKAVLENQLGYLRTRAKTILREEWIAFDFENDEFIPKKSQVLHEDVVVPALQLLRGSGGYPAVESAFQDALRELHEGTPGDAITDAATALQEALTALGCEGNALGPLIASAQKKGLLTGYDPRLISILDWVSADRSQKGDSHKAEGDGLSRDDAWLIVHVVGALVVRLLSGGNR